MYPLGPGTGSASGLKGNIGASSTRGPGTQTQSPLTVLRFWGRGIFAASGQGHEDLRAVP